MKTKNRIPLAALAALGLLAPGWHVHSSTQITVTESSFDRLALAIQVDSLKVNQVVLPIGRYASVAFDDCNMTNQPGWPKIPYSGFDIGLPPGGNVRLSWQIEQSTSIDLPAPVAPVPLIEKKDGQVVVQWQAVDEAYIQDQPSQVPATVLADNPTVMRGLRVQRIKFFPVQYVPATGKLTLIKRIRITVHYPSNTKGVPTLPGESMFFQHLLNYKVARYWKKIPAISKVRKTQTEIFGLAQERYKVYINAPSEIDFSRTGIYEITGTWFEDNGISTSGVVPGNIAMYAGLATELPRDIDTTTDPGELRPIPIQVLDNNNDGNFEGNDAIRFFGQGTSTWQFRTTDSSYHFQLNRYINTNVYWLALDAPSAHVKRFPQTDRTFSNAPSVQRTSTTGFYHMERNRVLRGYKGLTWYWDSLSSSTQIREYLSIPDVVPNSQALFKLFFKRFGTSTSSSINLDVAGNRYTAAPNAMVPSFSGDEQVQITSSASNTFLDGFTIVYQQQLKLHQGRLLFFGNHEQGSTRYTIDPNGTTDAMHVYRLTTPWDMVSLGTVSGTGQFNIDDSTDAAADVRFLVQTESTFSQPDSIRLDAPAVGNFAVSHLRNTSNSADYLVIAPEAFMPQAERLAAHRNVFGQDDITNPAVVRISDIYDEFSGGRIDPVAIRDFLYYAYHHWNNAPMVVVFMGDGHDDYKGYRYLVPNILPPFLIEADADDVCTDDFFAYLDPQESMNNSSRTVDIALGRLPARDAGEAKTMVDKIIAIESPDQRDMGPWRQRVVMVADDDWQRSQFDWIYDHARESEVVANSIESRNPSLEIKKIYFYDYTRDSKLEYPDARNDLIEVINNGCIAVNYVGHGGEYIWADEHAFAIADIDRLNNAPHYPIFFSASCSVGRFDHPNQESLTEELMRAVARGAGAGMAATRGTYDSENNKINARYFQELLGSPDSSCTLGAALLASKNGSGAGHNTRERYVLFGDPATKYHWEQLQVRFTETIDTLRARQIKTISGEIIKAGSRVNDLNGTILLQVYKAYKQKTHLVIDNRNITQDTLRYKIWSDFIFSGQTNVQNGRFSQTFLVPTKLAYGEAKAKVTAFTWDADRVGFGYVDGVYTGGTDTNNTVDDRDGPSISFSQADSSLAAGIVFDDIAKISLPTEIIILVEDSMGVDVTSQGPDEGLCVEIPRVLPKTNINSRFRYDQGNFRKGKARYSLEQGLMRSGEYDLYVTARDGLGNVSEKKLRLQLHADSVLTIADVFSHPNPFKGETKIYYKLSQPSEVTIKLFTRSGKLIRVFENASNPQEWDGTDQLGHPCANNVYFYKVIAKSSLDQTQQAEALDKLMLAR